MTPNKPPKNFVSATSVVNSTSSVKVTKSSSVPVVATPNKLIPPPKPPKTAIEKSSIASVAQRYHLKPTNLLKTEEVGSVSTTNLPAECESNDVVPKINVKAFAAKFNGGSSNTNTTTSTTPNWANKSLATLKLNKLKKALTPPRELTPKKDEVSEAMTGSNAIISTHDIVETHVSTPIDQDNSSKKSKKLLNRTFESILRSPEVIVKAMLVQELRFKTVVEGDDTTSKSASIAHVPTPQPGILHPTPREVTATPDRTETSTRNVLTYDSESDISPCEEIVKAEKEAHRRDVQQHQQMAEELMEQCVTFHHLMC